MDMHQRRGQPSTGVARIVRRMFDLYRPERMGRQPIELDRTIRDVVALLDSIAAAHEVRLNVEATDASGKLRLPDDAIRQVLYNVVVNAIEAELSLHGFVYLPLESAWDLKNNGKYSP